MRRWVRYLLEFLLAVVVVLALQQVGTSVFGDSDSDAEPAPPAPPAAQPTPPAAAEQAAEPLHDPPVDDGPPVTVHVIDGDETDDPDTDDPAPSAAADPGSDGTGVISAHTPGCAEAQQRAYAAIANAEALLGDLPDDETMMQLLVSSREQMLDALRKAAHAREDTVRWMRTVNGVCDPPVFTDDKIAMEGQAATEMWEAIADLAPSDPDPE